MSFSRSNVSRRDVIALAGALAGGSLTTFVGVRLLPPTVEKIVQTTTETTTRLTTVISVQTVTETRMVELTKTQVIEKTVTATTPYKRELPNLAKDARVNMWSFYYPWYSSEEAWTSKTVHSPLLGRYSSTDRLVINKHIDWATGYGINTFFVSWWGRGKREDIALKEHFLRSDLSNDMKFAILYESLKDEPPFDSARVLSDVEYLNRQFFQDSRYLTIKGKPVIFFYLARAYPDSAIKTMKELRNRFSVYLVGDVVYWQSPRENRQQELMTSFDAVTAYNMHTSVQSILDNYVPLLDRKYAEWFDAARAQGVGFIPQVLPGFDDRKYPGRTNLPLPRSVELFGKQIEIAKKYLDPSLNAMYITSFNEWYESTQVEPSIEEYFKYLQIIRDNV